MNNRNILVLTTLSCMFLGFIVPLVIWLAMKEDFEGGEKTHLTNLLNFELTILIAAILLMVVNIIPFLGQIICLIGGVLLWLFNVINILVATIKLTKNEEYKFPFALELIK